MSEAERLLDSMEADLGKKQLPCVVATIKKGVLLPQNSLLKKAYVHASKKKFIDAAEPTAATSSCTSSRAM